MRYIFTTLVFIAAMFSTAFYEPVLVTGKVTDETGAALAGVSVTEKGQKNGTATDANGSFSIKVASAKSTLLFQYVGYETQEVKLNSQQTVNIKLKPSVGKLEEVVVIGYGTKKRKELTYSTPSAIYGSRAPGLSMHDAEVYNTEDYDGITENRFRKVTDEPLSTFSIDVDGASYSNVRRMINYGQMPAEGAVRVEEFINYFKYNYPQPTGNDPFSINTEMSACPWNKEHKLVMVGLQGKEIATTNLPPSNLVFLIDVSGSMSDANKLPLVKASLKLLVDQLREQDHVAIVVYAGAAGLVLPSTNGMHKEKIMAAIDKLEAGGSTAGGAGIKLAYNVAKEQFKKGGNNRVILCTDGDFNVGMSSDDAMERLIEEERKSGVFLTVLGYGMGNYKDNKMQKLANKGNGNHAYIDGMNEAKKVLVNEFGGTMFTIAKDVKLQVEFNPVLVQAYRLVGYENRLLNKEDFNNDKKDAGELGSGHTVTALYEIIPVGVESDFIEDVDELKYQQPAKNKKSGLKNEIMTIKFRYKEPDANESKLMVHPLLDEKIPFEKTSENFRFATAVAQFGMLLRNSEFKGNTTYEKVIRQANAAIGADKEGYRTEFIKLVQNVQSLAKKHTKRDESVVID
ncbi:vWA domain-containing protein [Lacibacter sediminis]|uniref:von Willebrand factor type A domain-containing protein n=1 Tax=Lacibacter sediminis TaxID=2760713 RepID=A0A7G5XBY2_9BACT|nr:VWA domain-containing protein [Lacibacter sediminis]QNA42985.1 von Willebrand factor type A domain-containing protein [Lacibacter sediminis]